MKQKTRLLLLFLAASLGLNAQTVEVDKTFRVGHLDNGLTYYIRHNAKEKGLADFYLAQRVGSILEEPRQRGLAHFLEHMAFNGTEHFRGTPESPSIVHWCEAHGIKFGANLNAYTSVDETVYHVGSVPVTRSQVIDSTLLILHDWSHSLLLEGREIDKERGVVHEEWRTRRSRMATQRMMEDVLPIIYEGSKYADCLPIGSMDIVDHFPYQDLRDYYKKWYRPDLQAVIIVGDIDVDQMEQRIRRTFGAIPKPVNAARRVYYPVPDNDKLIIAARKDSEQPIMLATLYMKHDAAPDAEKVKVSYQRDSYIDLLVGQMLNGRMQEMQNQAVKPCLSASVRIGQYFISRTKDAISFSFGCRQENIEGSFRAAIGVAEQARQYGFTASELRRAKERFAASFARRAAEGDTRRNAYYVRKAQRHFLAGDPLTTEAYDLKLVKQFNADVTLRDVNDRVRQLVSNKNQVLTVYAPDKPGFKLPSESELARMVTSAEQAEVQPYREQVLPERLISQLPAKGSITSERKAAFGSTLLTLSNGVKVYVKPTQLAKDEVSMKFWGDHGTRYADDALQPNFSFISTAITSAGVASYDQTTLQKMLAGKMVRIQPGISDDEQYINGSSSATDLETLLQLTYLYFTSPRVDRGAFQSELDRMKSFLTNREANPQVSYNDSIVSIVYGNSPRVQPTKLQSLSRVDYDKILQIYRENFSDASHFTMVLVGNVDLNQLRGWLCQYIATLPTAQKGSQTTSRVHPYPDIVNADATHLFRKPMKTPSALVNIYYTFQEPFSPKSDAALDILCRSLSIAYTDSVREEKGGVYGVSVNYDLDRESHPTALLHISFRTDPKKYADIIPLVYRQLQWIAQRGPDGTTLEKVKSYLLKAYKQNTVNNGYWMYVLENQLKDGIDYHSGYEQLIQGMSGSDIRRVAEDLLKAKRRIEVTMLPEL